MVGNSKIKQRLLPFCAFFSAFTIVMTILVYSTDIQGRRYRKVLLNMSIINDFQSAAQDDPQLINYIRLNHLKPPSPTVTISHHSVESMPVEQPNFAEIFQYKKGGVFVETGAYRHGEVSRTFWLETVLGWHGLLTQPDPQDYKILQQHSSFRPNSYSANVCLSPTSNPKEASFRQTSIPNNFQVPINLTKVQCFPLFSLLLACNATDIDFLSLYAEKAEYQVLKTLPFHRVNIKVIGIVMTSENNEENKSELFQLTKLLSTHHYKLNETYSSNKHFLFTCSKGYNGCYTPKITI